METALEENIWYKVHSILIDHASERLMAYYNSIRFKTVPTNFICSLAFLQFLSKFLWNIEI